MLSYILDRDDSQFGGGGGCNEFCIEVRRVQTVGKYGTGTERE
jgi:hypothetical protein